jgi:DNA polymerase-3 subunit epsilon
LRDCAGGADRFVVVDTETTGVYSSDRVVEVAIVTLSLDGEVVDHFDTLVNPCRDVSATHIHGITASMVHDAPTFEDIAGDIAVRLHGACFVAHNAPFDRRMLGAEFDRLGDALVVERSVDTYVGSGRRLVDACSEHQIDLSGAHRASTDAVATAQLFLRLQSRCGAGAPIAAPPSLRRAGRVRRRDDSAAVKLSDTPLITYLASRLPYSGLAVISQLYLEVVGRAVSDLHLDVQERAELSTIAASLGLTDAQVSQAHRRYVYELIDAAIGDGVVTNEEYETLIRVASALGVDQDSAEHRVASFRTATVETRLAPGMQVVFTGNHETYPRDRLEIFARGLGLEPRSGVSKSTDLVVAADVSSRSGKAAKAHKYGIPVITVDEFVVAEIGEVLSASASVESLKVITCPDCHATRTVSATARAQSSKRCSDCAPLSAVRTISTLIEPTSTVVSTWAAPVVEWITCRRCTAAWSRQVSRGRKPHFCPSCLGTPNLAPPGP